MQIRTEDQEPIPNRRLAACCWGEGRPATCLVMLDEQGSLVDILYLPSLSGLQIAKRPGLQYNIAEDPKKVPSYFPAPYMWLEQIGKLPLPI